MDSDLQDNIIKVLSGFFVGWILLYIIKDLDVVIISLIQTVFFVIYYAGIDKILKKIKKKEVK